MQSEKTFKVVTAAAYVCNDMKTWKEECFETDKIDGYLFCFTPDDLFGSDNTAIVSSFAFI